MEAPLGFPHLADPFGLLDSTDDTEADEAEGEEQESADEEENEDEEDSANEDAAEENERASAAFEAMLAICRPELSGAGAGSTTVAATE